MSDIVERLRNLGMVSNDRSTFSVAAEEIERLREENEALRLVATAHEPELARLEAEIERLKAELQQARFPVGYGWVK